MSLDPNKKLTLPPKRPSAQRPDVVPPFLLGGRRGWRRLIVTGYGECGKRERERRDERGVRVSWMKAGMRVSVYEGWRSELWGTRWCPGWQPRWHYLRVCLGRKTEENRSEKEMETERKKERPTKRDSDGKSGGAREKNSQVGRRDSLQKDTRGQRGIRPTGQTTRVRNEQRKRLIPTCYLEETTARSSSIVLG